MKTIFFDPIHIQEVLSYSVSFVDMLAQGDTLASAEVNVSLFSGVDSNPAAMLFSGPTVDASGKVVNFNLQGGTKGSIYVIVVFGVGASTNQYIKEGYIATITTDNF